MSYLQNFGDSFYEFYSLLLFNVSMFFTLIKIYASYFKAAPFINVYSITVSTLILVLILCFVPKNLTFIV